MIRPGGNYGWPHVVGRAGSSNYIDPIIDFGPQSIAPSGASFSGMGPRRVLNDLFISCLRGEALIKVDVREDGEVLGYEELYKSTYGRIRDVVPHPEGGLLIATSNRDGRGPQTWG